MHEILKLCKKEKFDRVYIHLTTDGRDVPEKSAM
jgi:bisphosphoglycerate-independent phosphoglycerate mutase (AlkP superfamily)